jgi:hypothetical protein
MAQHVGTPLQTECKRKRQRFELVESEESCAAVECSDMDVVLEALNRYNKNTVNFMDVVVDMSKKGYPRELYENIYKEAYGSNFATPRPTRDMDSAFRRTLGEFLYDKIEEMPAEQRPFYWLLVPISNSKCSMMQKVLFVRHDDQWIIQYEKDWKLALSYAEVDENDQDVQSCILYHILNTFLTDIVSSMKKYQLELVRKRVEINALKALVDYEDNHLLTRVYLVSDILLDSSFCVNSVRDNLVFLKIPGGVASPDSKKTP